MYIDVRIAEAGNKLAFRYDPQNDVIQVSIRGELHAVYLNDYREPENACSLTSRADRDTICVDGPR